MPSPSQPQPQARYVVYSTGAQGLAVEATAATLGEATAAFHSIHDTYVDDGTLVEREVYRNPSGFPVLRDTRPPDGPDLGVWAERLWLADLWCVAGIVAAPSPAIKPRPEQVLRDRLTRILAAHLPATPGDECGLQMGPGLILRANARLYLTVDPRHGVSRVLVGWGNEFEGLAVYDVVDFEGNSDEAAVGLITQEMVDELDDLHMLSDWAGQATHAGAVPEDDPIGYVITGAGRQHRRFVWADGAPDPAGDYEVRTPVYALRPDTEPGGSFWVRGATDA